MIVRGMPERFWVVTTPTNLSVIEDICFDTDFPGLVRQGIGGLRPGEIEGVFASAGPARRFALTLLDERDNRTGGPVRTW